MWKARFAMEWSSSRWAIVVMLGLFGSGEAVDAGGIQDFGECTRYLVRNIYYDEAFRSVGGDAGLYASATHVAWTRRYMFGVDATALPPTVTVDVLLGPVLAEVDGTFWVFEFGAISDGVERFPSFEGWRERLDQLGVSRDVRLRRAKNLWAPLSWLDCRSKQLVWLAMIFGPFGVLALVVVALTGGSCILVWRGLSRGRLNRRLREGSRPS